MNVKLKPIQRPRERRRHQRVDVSLLGRYMLEDKREFPCQTTNMSPGGVAIVAAVRGRIGERVVAYFEHVGRIEGTVARHTDRGFALTFNMPFAKREKIANQLTWLANRDTLGMPEDRRHERIVPNLRHSMLKLEGDHEHVVKLIDVSISGAAVTTPLTAPLGTHVVLGRTPGRVVRLFDGGLGISFDNVIPLDRFDENIVL
ncbi:MAG: PilZ domain-containing protein [Beijerinckiaceae bacterium]